MAGAELQGQGPESPDDESTQKKMEGSDGGKEETRKAEGDEAASASAPAPAPAAPAPS